MIQINQVGFVFEISYRKTNWFNIW